FILACAFGVGLLATLYFLPYGQYKSHVWYSFAISSLQAGVIINFGLGWLNLIPVPPLDGSKILAYFLSPRLAAQYLQIGRYGFIILIVLLATGLLGMTLGPLVRWSATLLFGALGLM
ncbi:MAG: site-2 protease family protein, partial [Desulfovibrio sp.]|nr:site-2 protease family protein [Desulfovibrio sp.]